jgi:hypothetical protein
VRIDGTEAPLVAFVLLNSVLPTEREQRSIKVLEACLRLVNLAVLIPLQSDALTVPRRDQA